MAVHNLKILDGAGTAASITTFYDNAQLAHTQVVRAVIGPMSSSSFVPTTASQWTSVAASTGTFLELDLHNYSIGASPRMDVSCSVCYANCLGAPVWTGCLQAWSQIHFIPSMTNASALVSSGCDTYTANVNSASVIAIPGLQFQDNIYVSSIAASAQASGSVIVQGRLSG